MHANLKRRNRGYILSSKHTYRPMRARVVAQLFYKEIYKIHFEGFFKVIFRACMLACAGYFHFVQKLNHWLNLSLC